jgi:type IV pilus assembly protein PilX
MMKRKLSSFAVAPNRQGGVVLILGLVVLVVLTLIGVSNMRSSMMEERMTGGFNDRANLALESAELALREAEQYLDGASVGPFDGSKPGLHAIKHNGDDYSFWKGSSCSATSFNWSNGACSYATSSKQLPHTAAAPRYVIEYFADALVIDGPISAGKAKQYVKVYRITARGVGGQGSTAVVLQTTFKR